MKAPRIQIAGAAVCIIAALSLYAYGYLNEPRLRDGDAQQRAYARQVLKSQSRDMGQEAALAEVYWRRYGDVAADPIVGQNGALGVFGAREHYNRHGRRENRIWGDTKK
jgi:hypothetical protein